MNIITGSLDSELVEILTPIIKDTRGYIAGGVFKDLETSFNENINKNITATHYKHKPKTPSGRLVKFKDIDVFFRNKEDFEHALNLFKNSKFHFLNFENNNCVSFNTYMKNENSSTVIISVELIRSIFGDPESVIKSFDNSVSQKALIVDDDDNIQIIQSEFYAHDLENNILRLTDASMIKNSYSLPERIVRYHKYGYDPFHPEVLEYNSENLQKIYTTLGYEINDKIWKEVEPKETFLHFFYDTFKDAPTIKSKHGSFYSNDTRKENLIEWLYSLRDINYWKEKKINAGKDKSFDPIFNLLAKSLSNYYLKNFTKLSIKEKRVISIEEVISELEIRSNFNNRYPNEITYYQYEFYNALNNKNSLNEEEHLLMALFLAYDRVKANSYRFSLMVNGYSDAAVFHALYEKTKDLKTIKEILYNLTKNWSGEYLTPQLLREDTNNIDLILQLVKMNQESGILLLGGSLEVKTSHHRDTPSKSTLFLELFNNIITGNYKPLVDEGPLF